MSYVFCVECPRLIHVGSTPDNRPTIRKDRKLEAIGIELKQEPVVADLAHPLQMMGKLLKIQFGRAALRHLHGIAAAQTGRVRPMFA